MDRNNLEEATSDISPVITRMDVNVTDDSDGDGFEERWRSRVGSQQYGLRLRRLPKYAIDNLLMSPN